MRTRFVAVTYLTKTGLYEIKALPVPYNAKLMGIRGYRGKVQGQEVVYKEHIINGYL